MYFYNFDQCLKITKIFGAYPYKSKSWLQTAYCASYIFNCACLSYFVIYYCIDKENLILMDIIGAVNVVFYYYLGSLTLSTLFIKRFAILEIVNLIDTKFWKVEDLQESPEKEKYLRVIQTLIIKYKIALRFMLLDLCLCLYGESIIKGKLNVDTFPVKFYIPNGLHPNFIIFLDCFIAIIIMLSAIVTDFTLFTTITLTEIQYHMLNDELINIFNHAIVTSRSITEIKLKKCADHLTFLVANKNNEAFSILLLLYMGLNIVSLCTTMYVVSTGYSVEESLRAFAYSTGLFLQYLIFYCLPAQQLVNTAEQAPTSLFLSQWQDFPSHYKNVLFLIGMCQQKVYLTAGGLLDIDHQSGLAAMKTVMSYWGFLNTVAAK